MTPQEYLNRLAAASTFLANTISMLAVARIAVRDLSADASERDHELAHIRVAAATEWRDKARTEFNAVLNMMPEGIR